jgi:HAD superfamily hydrolase (TIGR01509 family)
MPELIIYDCDGTLIDSERIVADLCLAEIHALGLRHWTMQQYVESFVGMPGKVGWSRVAIELGRPLPEGFNEALDARIDQSFEANLRALPGVREAVTAIDGRRCVASTTGQPYLSQNIRTAGLHDLFGDHVFSASQVKRAKPAPDVFLFSASQMGADPKDCLVIEDSVPGVTAARRAGMRVIGFTGAAFDPAGMRDRLTAAGALSVAHHMAELPPIVSSLRAALT